MHTLHNTYSSRKLELKTRTRVHARGHGVSKSQACAHIQIAHGIQVGQRDHPCRQPREPTT